MRLWDSFLSQYRLKHTFINKSTRVLTQNKDECMWISFTLWHDKFCVQSFNPQRWRELSVWAVLQPATRGRLMFFVMSSIFMNIYWMVQHKKTLLSCIMGDVGCGSLTLWICLITNTCSSHWRLKRLESVSSCTGLPGRASGGFLLEALATLCSLVMIQYFPADCTKFAGKTSALSDGCQASTRLLAPMVKLWGPDGAELPTSGNNDTTDRWCEVPLTSTWILP